MTAYVQHGTVGYCAVARRTVRVITNLLPRYHINLNNRNMPQDVELSPLSKA